MIAKNLDYEYILNDIIDKAFTFGVSNYDVEMFIFLSERLKFKREANSLYIKYYPEVVNVIIILFSNSIYRLTRSFSVSVTSEIG